MQSGWKQFLKQRFASTSQYYCLGIHFCRKGLTISAFKSSGEKPVWVMQHFIDIERWQADLETWVKQKKLNNTPTFVFLATEHYEMVQVDKPSVADEEIAQALRWSIKDIVVLEGELVVDYFELPAQPAGGNKVNVVATKADVIRSVSEGVIGSELRLSQITVAELAPCDILADYPEPCVSISQEAGQDICLSIVKDGQLYFSRRLRGYENIKSFSPEELKMGSVDNLTLEVQRSMDYFESQLRQAPIKKIVVNVDSPHLDAICNIMRELTLIDVMPLQYAFDIEESIELKSAFLCGLAAASANKLMEAKV
jgi:MSHA biogenesis protein MshI